MQDIRMKDERDEEGNGFLTVEIEQNGTWTSLSRTWFWDGKATEVWVRCDDVKQISISQFTDKRSTWSKKQFKNVPYLGQHFNMTTLKRKDAPLKKKGDA